jgi:tRNA(adenine34) deaminase
MQNHEYFMSEAILEAKESVLKGNGPIGCVITKDGVIVARGHNEEGTNCDPTAHAEIVVIRRLCSQLGTKNLEGHTLYSTLQPCGMCSVACLWANISVVVYGASRETVSPVLFAIKHLNTIDFIADASNKDVQVVPNVLNKECSELYQRYWEQQSSGS